MMDLPKNDGERFPKAAGDSAPARGRVGPAVCHDQTTTGHQGARVLRLEPDYPLICTRTCGFHGILNPLRRVNLADEGVEVVCGHAHVATFGAGRQGFTVPKDSPIVFSSPPILPILLILPILHSSDELAMVWVRGGREIRVPGRVGLWKCWVTPDLCESDIPAT